MAVRDAWRQRRDDVGAEQVRHRVVAEERGKERRDRRQRRDVVGDRARYAFVGEPDVERVGQSTREADDHQREEDADREHLSRVLEGRVHARSHAAMLGGQGVHDAGAIGRGEHAHRDAVQEQEQTEDRIGKVRGEKLQQEERDGRSGHAADGEGSSAVLIGEPPTQRTGRRGTRR